MKLQLVSKKPHLRGCRAALIAALIFAILYAIEPEAQAQTLRTHPVQVRVQDKFPAAIQFSCSVNYARTQCEKDVLALRQKLALYPVEELGPWSFALASSAELRHVVHDLGGDLHSPAITIIGSRITVLDEALFAKTSVRRDETLERLRNVRDSALLDFALSHELGHALCHEVDEDLANQYAERLRNRRFTGCKTSKHHTFATIITQH